jgi:hypothetical protein
VIVVLAEEYPLISTYFGSYLLLLTFKSINGRAISLRHRHVLAVTARDGVGGLRSIYAQHHQNAVGMQAVSDRRWRIGYVERQAEGA